MEKLIQAIIAFTNTRKQTILRICGHGASGKTSFATALHQAYKDGQSQLIEADAYIISGQHSKDTFLQYDFQEKEDFYHITACHPARHELNGLKRDVAMLRRGMDVLTPDFPWLPEKHLRSHCPVTIVEGMTPTFLDSQLFDVSIFLYTDSDTELQRRLERDVAHRGRNPEFIQQTHDHRRRQYDLYMADYQSQFDIVINQSGNNFQVEKAIFPTR